MIMSLRDVNKTRVYVAEQNSRVGDFENNNFLWIMLLAVISIGDTRWASKESPCH